jgi:hypothetical protein
MSIDTKYTYNPLPYNIVDKANNSNPNGIKPSYQYKKKRVIWLNTKYATSSINDGNTTYFEFSFDVPPFQLYNQTELKVISFTSNQHASNPMYIKIKNLMYDIQSSWCNDMEGFPMLYVSHVGANGLLPNDKISITLVPQMINNITIKVNDSFIARDTGYTISAGGAGNFIIGLLFEDTDLIADNIVSQYK